LEAFQPKKLVALSLGDILRGNLVQSIADRDVMQQVSALRAPVVPLDLGGRCNQLHE